MAEEEMIKYRIAIQRYANGEPVDYANLMVKTTIKNVKEFRAVLVWFLKNG